jgi:hypothetical protein
MEETETDNPRAYIASINQIEGYSEKILIYHIRQLIDAGFIDGEVIDSIGGVGFNIRRLTWVGHEFVENSRNDTLWSKAKDTVVSKTGGISVDILSEVLKRLVSGAVFGT